ncbi:hypothetical protein GCM10007973_11720 [Polymorphobacter multimanifer]|uniref:Uncharacterized protein n=1 Tax=Polymorphobacter multimanifer TaxID=1070431 RepID=A0A841L6T6_9SPHN|nr:hypothetical protein [Polymorphobacter multimanifer]MBB6227271.1 hypothetical protein [Polymorphobacter multimanifer]GGI76489.1 hypothetical protein GCM10007973_11720 [Polymorphobacter multimanifer]
MSDNIRYLIPLFGMLIPIVAIAGGIFTQVFKRWASLKEKQLELTARLTAENAAQYAAKIERLEAHVAVLNRIVTDRNEGLTAQIESLRETPKIN